MYDSTPQNLINISYSFNIDYVCEVMRMTPHHVYHTLTTIDVVLDNQPIPNYIDFYHILSDVLFICSDPSLRGLNNIKTSIRVDYLTYIYDTMGNDYYNFLEDEEDCGFDPSDIEVGRAVEMMADLGLLVQNILVLGVFSNIPPYACEALMEWMDNYSVDYVKFCEFNTLHSLTNGVIHLPLYVVNQEGEREIVNDLRLSRRTTNRRLSYHPSSAFRKAPYNAVGSAKHFTRFGN